MNSINLSNPAALTGRYGLGFAAPKPQRAMQNLFSVNPADISRYRSHKKSKQNDTFPTWMVLSAVQAFLGDSLILRFVGGMFKKTIGMNEKIDLLSGVEEMCDFCENATQTVWDLATNDTVTLDADAPKQTANNNMKPTNDIGNDTVTNLEKWRDRHQQSQKPENVNYRNSLKFAAP
jgi:hypothetical protein